MTGIFSWVDYFFHLWRHELLMIIRAVNSFGKLHLPLVNVSLGFLSWRRCKTRHSDFFLQRHTEGMFEPINISFCRPLAEVYLFWIWFELVKIWLEGDFHIHFLPILISHISQWILLKNYINCIISGSDVDVGSMDWTLLTTSEENFNTEPK